MSELERNGYMCGVVGCVDVAVRIARANGVKWAVRRAARHTYGRSESVARGWKRVSEASGRRADSLDACVRGVRSTRWFNITCCTRKHQSAKIACCKSPIPIPYATPMPR